MYNFQIQQMLQWENYSQHTKLMESKETTPWQQFEYAREYLNWEQLLKLHQTHPNNNYEIYSTLQTLGILIFPSMQSGVPEFLENRLLTQYYTKSLNFPKAHTSIGQAITSCPEELTQTKTLLLLMKMQIMYTEARHNDLVIFLPTLLEDCRESNNIMGKWITIKLLAQTHLANNEPDEARQYILATQGLALTLNTPTTLWESYVLHLETQTPLPRPNCPPPSDLTFFPSPKNVLNHKFKLTEYLLEQTPCQIKKPSLTKPENNR